MITINGRILENRYTSAQWAATTTILPDRVFGYEVDGSGNPIGQKMGDGIHLWNDLKYWYNGALPFPYNIPSNSDTPIIINFTNSTIKFGANAAVNIGADLTKLTANPTIYYELIDAIDDTITTPYNNVATLAKQWVDNTHTSLVSITILPDTDTGVSGGVTRDNINVIIKP